MQDLQQFHPRDSAKTVATRCHSLVFKEHVNVIPMPECPRDVAVRFGVGIFESAHGLVGENNAPSEITVRAVALDDCEVPSWIRFLRENREVKSTGPAAETCNLHDCRPRKASANFSPVSSAKAA